MSAERDGDAAVPQQPGCLKAVLREIDATLPGQLAALHESLAHLSRSPLLAATEHPPAKKGTRDA
jgi:hypothetical protein